METIIDTLTERIKDIGNPVAVGLDTLIDYLPDNQKRFCSNADDAANVICDFNFMLIERLASVVPAVKVQFACYAMLGSAGVQAFARTVSYARYCGMLAIADAKTGDIGSTAACYSAAFIGKVKINNSIMDAPFCSDFLTINPYLGIDGVQPFIDDCSSNNRGLFVLVKTSNPSSAQFQDMRFDDGRTLYETIGDMVEEWGKDIRGRSGYSAIGAVVGATHIKEARSLRERMPHTFFLIPGYGVQGGGAEGAAACFDSNGNGGIVNNSRGIINAHNSERYSGMRAQDAAYAAVLDMREDLMKYLC